MIGGPWPADWNVPVDRSSGFLPGTDLASSTQVLYQNMPVNYNLLSGTSTEIRIGRDYSGVRLPEGTESVEIVDLAKDAQVVRFKHSAIGYTPSDGFSETRRRAAFRVEVYENGTRVSVNDFMPTS